jgi:hypothetical protein
MRVRDSSNIFLRGMAKIDAQNEIKAALTALVDILRSDPDAPQYTMKKEAALRRAEKALTE